MTLRSSLVARLVRTYPFYTGVGTFANSSLVRMLSGPSSEIAWGKVSGGYEVASPLDDYVGRAIYFAGDLDPKVTWACKRFVRPGDTVLDIGANLGLVTFILAALVGPKGKVHSFEPIPAMQECLRQGIERNRVSNVKIHDYALGEAPGNLVLSVPDDHAGRASFVRTMPHSHNITVPVKTLTDVLKAESLGKIRLIKIDVEGYEAEVFQGGLQALSKNPPDVILFELNGDEQYMHESRAVRILDSLGYRFFALPKRYVRMDLEPVKVSDACPDNAHDFVAVHSRVNL